MPNEFTCACPTCQRSIAIPADAVPGKPVRCPHCKQICSWSAQETGTRTLEHAPPATATLAPRTTAAPPETAARNTDAIQATLPLPSRHPVKAAAAAQKIGRFEIRRVLGEGGFGIVYEAYDPQLDRAIALKVAKLGGDNEQRKKRFLREAKSAASLRHPHIVPLFEFGQDGDQFYLALAYIPGQSLDHVMRELNAKNAKMDCRLAATLVRHLAEALAYAHGLGIVHRDIKPHNVMLDERGEPLLMDFGLAAREEDEKLTRDGAIMGTAAYLAPEQYHGEPTAASDQYSLGVTLYEFLTGETPFAGPADLQVYHHLHTEPESPRKRNREVSRDLETICLKCLAKSATARYATTRHLADDLGRYLAGEPIHARPIGSVERTWRWMKHHPARASAAVGTFLFFIVSVVAGLAVLHLDNVKALEHNAELKKEVTEKEYQRTLAVNNAIEKEIQRTLAVKNADEKELQRQQAVEKTIRMTVEKGQRLLEEGDYTGALLYYVEAAALEDAASPHHAKHQIRLAAVLRQCPRLVQTMFHAKAVNHVEFDPNEDWLLSASQDGTVGMWNIATGKPRFEVSPKHSGAVNIATFSLDGQRILSAGEDKFACLWDARTGERLDSPLKHRDPVFHAAFSPTGDGTFLTVAGQRYASTYQNNTPAIMIPQITYLRLPNGTMIPQTRMVQVSPGISTQQEPRGGVYLWNPRSLEKPKIFTQAGWINHAEFRGDGQAIVASFGGFKGNGVCVYYPNREKERGPIMRHSTEVFQASFSPDGKKAVASSGAMDANAGHARIWDVEKGELAVLPFKHQAQVRAAWFSPDGERILTASADMTALLWDGQNGALLSLPMRHRDRLTGAWFSRDGRRVLTASQDGSARVWDAFTGQPLTPFLKHASPVLCATFSRSGTQLATGCQEGVIRVWDLVTPTWDWPIVNSRSVLPPVGSMMSTFQSGSKTARNIKTVPERIITSAIFSPGSQFLLTSTGSRYVDMLPGGGQAQAASGLQNTHVCVWDAAKGTLAFPPHSHRHAFSADWLASAGRLAVLTEDKTASIELLNLSDGQTTGQIAIPPNEKVRTMHVLPDGSPVAVTVETERKASSATQQVRVRKGEAGETAAPAISVQGTLEYLALSRDGRRLAVLFSQALPSDKKEKRLVWMLQVWELTSNAVTPLGTPLVQPRPMNKVLWHPHGDRLVSYQSGEMSSSGMAQESDAFLWHLGNDKPISLRHTGAIAHVGFGSQGKEILTCSHDRSARVWDAMTGQPITPALEHRGSVFYASHSDQGIIVSAGRDNTACLWDAATGERMGPPLRHHDWVVHASFDGQGHRVATASCDGTARVWDLAPLPFTLPQWKELAQMLAAHRLDAAQGLTPISSTTLAERWSHWSGQSPALFQRSRAGAATWLAQEWEQAREHQDWWGLTILSDPLLVIEPNNKNLWWWRARSQAQLRQSEPAQRSFTRVYQLGDQSPEVHQALLLLAMDLGQKEAYRAQTQLLLEAMSLPENQKGPLGEEPMAPVARGQTTTVVYAKPSNQVDAITALRACLAAPDSLDRFHDMVPILEKLAKQSPLSAMQRGALDCRLGQFEEAARNLTAYLQTKPTIEGNKAYALLFLTLAQSQSGQMEAARESYRQALVSVEEAINPSTTLKFGRRPLTWTQHLELRLLQREIDRVLNGSTKGR